MHRTIVFLVLGLFLVLLHCQTQILVAWVTPRIVHGGSPSVGHSLLPQCSHQEGDETLDVEGGADGRGRSLWSPRGAGFQEWCCPAVAAGGDSLEEGDQWAGLWLCRRLRISWEQTLESRCQRSSPRSVSVCACLGPRHTEPSELCSQSELMGQLTSGLNLNKTCAAGAWTRRLSFIPGFCAVTQTQTNSLASFL